MARARLRFVAMFLVLAVVTLLVGQVGDWSYAAVVGWSAASLTFVLWVWAVTHGKDAAQTAAHALQDDPNRVLTDVLILGASMASLVAVGFVLVQASSANGLRQGLLAGLAVLSVTLSWTLVHTVFSLRYARLYYGKPQGGVDFNEDDPPTYVDFMYLAFTVGTAFAVSDTNITSRPMRATVLRHTLLSYLFGAVILGSTVNLIAGL